MESTLDLIQKSIAKKLEIDVTTIKPESTLEELGLDSLDTFDLIFEFEHTVRCWALFNSFENKSTRKNGSFLNFCFHNIHSDKNFDQGRIDSSYWYLPQVFPSHLFHRPIQFSFDTWSFGMLSARCTLYDTE